MSETLQLGGLNFEVRRSDRRKTLGLTVDRSGGLIAHAPAHTSTDELSRWIGRKLLWVYRKLALKEAAAPKIRPPEFVTGESFSYLGRRYRLKVVKEQDLPLRFDGARFLLRQSAVPAQEHFRRWYIQAGTEWLKRRAESLSRRTGTHPERIEVRDLGYRWGSCGKNGVLYFNWKALQLPVRLLDYVIVHELVHLRERHHGPAFWSTLGNALPDWTARKEALARQGADYLRFGFSG